MLERTGSSLKSCSCTLQRVLPKPPAPVATKRSRQHLHTGFWQHGALAMEIASTWPAWYRSLDAFLDSDPNELGGSASSSTTTTTTPPPHTSLVASAFLLDFLYPNAARKLLRRLYPGLPQPQDSKLSAASPASRRRHYTSSTVAEEPVSQTHTGFHDALEPSHVRHFKRTTRAPQRQPSTTSYSEAIGGTTGPHAAIAKFVASSYKEAEAEAEAEDTATEWADEQQFSAASLLSDLLSRQPRKHFSEAWNAYCRLRREEQACFRRDMVIYLCGSQGIVETGRAISLFRQIPIDDWDYDLLAAGVLILLRSGDLENAIDRFNAGLKSKGLIAGLGFILADTIAHRNWPVLVRVWLDFYDSALKLDPNIKPEDICLESREDASDPELLFFSFEQYLATKGVKSVRAINLYETSKRGLKALRLKLAHLSIMGPCQPEQAVDILKACGDHGLYRDYLLRILEHWQETDLRSSIAWLAEIYKAYGALPGAEPSVPLLRGMFNLFFPSHADGLEQVYKDWNRTQGGLDQWGYEKFLKYYAGLGDVKAVRDLWKRYVRSFPRVLQDPRAFRSTMNVFAQVGDAASAEKEMRTMTDQYGVRPDLDIWNTLLKCYVRTNNFRRVAACFEEICKLHRPDSFTYAHAMAMSAKKGDLDATLSYFSRAQRDRVPISKEMAMSLIMVCCRSERLPEAERILVELAERRVSSTAIWNQLIYFNGMQGKLKKCYELLQLMKKYDVAWDHQTHEFLLQALVNVDQVQPAYRLLRSAVQDKVFPVGPQHFAIVMAGAVRTGELKLVEIIASQLDRAGQSRNFSAQTALVDAAFQKAPASRRARELGREFVKHMQSLLDGPSSAAAASAGGGGGSDDAISSVSDDLRNLRKQTKHIGHAIRLLVELRDFPSAEELVNLYAKVFRKYKANEPFPPEVVSALMLGYLKDRKYQQVHKMWSQTWESVLTRGRRRNAEEEEEEEGSGIYPAHQYDLSRPISIVARTFREQSNGTGLLGCVRQVTQAGFQLTRSNWNVIIQYLAELGQWEPAMEWCEKMLMPRWRGWASSRRSLQERRHMKNTRLLQASRTAVLSLQRQWLKLHKLAAWSPAVSAKLKQIEKLYPRLYHAFTTTDYEHMARVLEGATAPPRHQSLTKGAAQLLKPFSHRELRAMQRSLEKRLRGKRWGARTLERKSIAAPPWAARKMAQRSKAKATKTPATPVSTSREKGEVQEPMTITIP